MSELYTGYPCLFRFMMIHVAYLFLFDFERLQHVTNTRDGLEYGVYDPWNKTEYQWWFNDDSFPGRKKQSLIYFNIIWYYIILYILYIHTHCTCAFISYWKILETLPVAIKIGTWPCNYVLSPTLMGTSYWYIWKYHILSRILTAGARPRRLRWLEAAGYGRGVSGSDGLWD